MLTTWPSASGVGRTETPRPTRRQHVIRLVMRAVITGTVVWGAMWGATACTATPPTEPLATGIPRSDGGAPPIPYVDDQDPAIETYRVLRRIDPCALLDPGAAERAIAGSTADQLVPGPSPAVCTLTVLPEGAHRQVDAWTLTVEVGIRFDDTVRDHPDLTRQTIPGAPDTAVYREPAVSDHRCSLVRPVADTVGIQIEVESPLFATSPPQPPCEVAMRVLEDTAERWRTLPQRADNLTTPRLPLTESDPCVATHAIGETLDWTARARPDLYSCTVVDRPGPDTPASGPADTAPSSPTETGQPDTPDTDPVKPPGEAEADSGAGSLTITYEVRADPASEEPSAGAHEPITVAGRAGTRTNIDGTCEIAVAVTDKVAVDTADGSHVQTITVTAATCDQATKAAAVVMDTVARR